MSEAKPPERIWIGRTGTWLDEAGKESAWPHLMHNGRIPYVLESDKEELLDVMEKAVTALRIYAGNWSRTATELEAVLTQNGRGKETP